VVRWFHPPWVMRGRAATDNWTVVSIKNDWATVF
jgi:hypothetical protein